MLWSIAAVVPTVEAFAFLSILRFLNAENLLRAPQHSICGVRDQRDLLLLLLYMHYRLTQIIGDTRTADAMRWRVGGTAVGEDLLPIAAPVYVEALSKVPKRRQLPQPIAVVCGLSVGKSKEIRQIRG